MLGLGAFAFLQPWLLTALIALPALWVLLRVTPPAPQSVRFPAIRLLSGLIPPEETPARTPPWLLLLRLLAAALLILGLAGPVMHPAAQLSGSGPLVLVVDNGWAAGKAWPERRQAMEAMLDRAERDGRRVVLLTTAPERSDAPLAASDPLPPAQAREQVLALEPRPWPVDLEAARGVAEELRITGSAHVVWVAEGLAAPGTRALGQALQRLGRLDVLRPEAGAAAMTILPPEQGRRDLAVPIRRASGEGERNVTLVASGEDGRLVGSASARFEAGERETTGAFDLPLELRNRITRIGIEGENHAGAVALLDGRWQRRPVGLVSAGPLDDAQPLLSEGYYLERALAPFAEIGRGGIERLLERELSVIVLPDRGAVTRESRERLAAFVEEGGVLLRFAGPTTARELTGPEAAQAAEGEPLLPVLLRRGGRALGGAMSWDNSARLAPFAANSPFARLDIPEDIRVHRQVLAEPALDLEEKTWARLSDGTPLVTAERRGDGWLVLMHTTANTEWSNLAISGLFVEMLQRIVDMGEGVAATGDETLPPQRVLDGFGQPASPGAGVRRITADALAEGRISPRHPPGLYGGEGNRRAHNLGPAVGQPEPLAELPRGVSLAGFDMQPETRIGPWLLLAALVLMLADFLIALWLRGLMPGVGQQRRRRAGSAGAAMVLAGALVVIPGAASEAHADDEFALQATLDTRFAYIETGDAEADRITREGLEGLSRTLTRRTTVEPASPLGVDLSRHDLSFFPLLYWSISPNQRDLTGTEARKLSDFMRSGGTMIVDLRESGGGDLMGGNSPGRQALQRLTRDVDMPPLKPVPEDHVLTRAFYLMDDFPGRHGGDTLWVEDTSEATGEGVASLIVGNSDWVSAWAVGDNGRPLYSVSPGGERQREMARRFGVNLVMYALTGDYKADQVHVPEILERLGQ